MSKAPPVDRRGSHLTPGERFKNWCAGVVQIWPIVLPLLAGTVYGNSEAVRGLVHGQIAEADGQTEVLANGSTFAESMVKYTQEMNARVDALEGRVAVQKADLSLDDKKNLKQLQSLLSAMDARLQAVEELVQ